MKGALMSQSAAHAPHISSLKFRPVISQSSAFAFSYLSLYCPHLLLRYSVLMGERESAGARFL
jgi:hypothetical protein